MDQTFERMESNVRSYSRNFPVSFVKGSNATLTDQEGNQYIDFFAGAGALNFGHNHPLIKEAILEYLQEDNILHALDMFTPAREQLLSTIENDLLKPRNLTYRVMSCGPTGTNAVEAALKLARKVKQRTNIIAFSGAFHGMSLGALAASSDSFSRHGAGVPLGNISFLPYFNAFPDPDLSLEYLESVLTDDHSGIDFPAAIILETVQAEGGINVAPVEWLQKLRAICDRYDILMIVDDIQVGVGRTGHFFSFERAGIVPDMVTLSKSISGLGLPLSLLLIKPEIDLFQPAEHNGTFRGNQLAFVGSKTAIQLYQKLDMDSIVQKKEALIKDFLETNIKPLHKDIDIRGIGMIWGIDTSKIDGSITKKLQQGCFKRNLVLEKAGRKDQVLKLMPPLLIPEETLMEGLNILKAVCEDVLADH